MQTSFNPDGSSTLLAWSLVDLVVGVANATKEGYELDIETNEYYPQQLGGLFTVTFKPHEELQEFVESTGQEVQPLPVEKQSQDTSSVIKDEVVSTDTTQVSKDTEVIKTTEVVTKTHKEPKTKK